MIQRLALLIGLVLVLGSTGTLAANSLSAAPLASRSGTINSVDLKHKQLDVRQSDGSHLRLKVSGTSRLARNGGRVQLNGLSLRDSMTVQFDPATHVISQLAASGPKVSVASGRVKGVSRSTGMIKVGQKQFQTNAATRIARNGHVAALGALTRRDSLVVHFAPGTNFAMDVIAEGPEEGEVEGTITGLSGSSVTITPDNGTPAVTVTADANTLIEVNDQSATVADLKLGMKADAEYDPTTLVAFSIEAETEANASVTGTVAGVDTTANTITINPDGGGAPLTLNVDAFTEVEVNGENSTLASVLVGMPVTAEYDTTTMTATQIQAGSGEPGEGSDEGEVEGTVQAVTTTTITIAPSDGSSPITLTVDGSTEIEVNDEPATLQQITVGDPVKAEYDTTTLLAREIKAGAGGEDLPHH